MSDQMMHIPFVVCPECWTETPLTTRGGRMVFMDHERKVVVQGRTMDFEGPIINGTESCAGNLTEVPPSRFPNR